MGASDVRSKLAGEKLRSYIVARLDVMLPGTRVGTWEVPDDGSQRARIRLEWMGRSLNMVINYPDYAAVSPEARIRGFEGLIRRAVAALRGEVSGDAPGSQPPFRPTKPAEDRPGYGVRERR